MKLYKAINEQVPTYSEEELLLMENEILRDELTFQENMRSLELMETVLNCIQQEGEVSKSVEIMFGDSVEDKASFKEELEAAYEVFIANKFNHNLEITKLKNLAKTLQNKTNIARKYLIDNISKIEFPVKCKVLQGITTLQSVYREIHDMLMKIRSRSVDSMSQKDCRECIAEFIELSHNITRDFKGKYFDKMELDKENLNSPEEAKRFIERDTKDMASNVDRSVSALADLITAFSNVVAKAEVNNSEKYINQFSRGIFFLARQEGWVVLQVISSLYNAMKAQTKA